MANRRQFIGATLAVGAASTGPWFIRDLRAQSQPIRIGIPTAMTGTWAVLGTQVQRGARLWAKEVNAKGGIDGRQVELLFEDSQGQPAVCLRKAEELVQKGKVNILTGVIVSSEALAILPKLAEWNAVFVSAGDGVILAGVHKGFADLVRVGLISSMPRLFAVQAEKSDAIHRYVQTGVYSDAADPTTVADSISVSCPSNAHWARRAILETKGATVTVSDDEILEAQARLTAMTGVFTEPAGAAAFAGLVKVQAGAGALPKDAEVVVLTTGHGLKDIDAPLARVKIPPAIEPTLDAVPVT